MNNEELKNKILDFMGNNSLTVIATIDSETNKPECAVIAFSENENLELVFGTSFKTRKYKNLQTNPHVSFVIGWDGGVGTVQYEGVAKELSPEESKTHSRIMLNKNPRSEKFTLMPEQRYFKVKPTWIRLLDLSKKPDETYELRFDTVA